MKTVEEFITENKYIDDAEKRTEAVRKYIEKRENTEYTPDELRMLADFLTENDTSVLSERQLRRRASHELGGGALKSVGADGADYRLPIRRYDLFADRQAKMKNDRRRRAYYAFKRGRDWYEFRGERIPIRFILKSVPINHFLSERSQINPHT